MARDQIQVHRGLANQLPVNLAQGEMGFTTDSEDLYIGGVSANVKLNGLKGLVDVSFYGAKGDGVTDDTDAINNAIAQGDVIYFPKKVYKVSDELLFKHGQTILAPQGVKFDGTGFIGTTGTAVLRVKNEGADYFALPDIASDINKGDNTISFSLAHGLNEGDVLCLYDNTDFSFSSERDYYRKSEFVEVAEVIDSTNVRLTSYVFDTYTVLNPNFGVYKMNMGTFNVVGSVETYQDKTGAYFGIVLERLRDFNLKNLKGVTVTGHSGISLISSYNGILECVAKQSGDSGGYDYGLAIGNCQNIEVVGDFSARRHGLTHGGNDGIGFIINRCISTKGNVSNTGEGGTQALDYHGNSSVCSFKGFVQGGVLLGGESHNIKAHIIADERGLGVYCANWTKFDHDISNCYIETDKDPNALALGRGVVDFGGSQITEVDNMLNGTFNMSNIVVNAPNADKCVVVRARNVNQTLTGRRNIDLTGARLKGKLGAAAIIQTSDQTGTRNFDKVNCRGLEDFGEAHSIANVDTLLFKEQKDIESITLNTGVKTVTSVVTFADPYPAGYIPCVSVVCQDNVVQGTTVAPIISSVSNTQFTLVVNTLDGGNFGTNNTIDFYWESR